MQEHWIHTAYYWMFWAGTWLHLDIFGHSAKFLAQMWLVCLHPIMWDLTVSPYYSIHLPTGKTVSSSEWKPPFFPRKEWAILCPINDAVSVIFLTISPPLAGLGRLHCEPELKDTCLEKIPQSLTSERWIFLCKWMVLVEKAGLCVKYAGLL